MKLIDLKRIYGLIYMLYFIDGLHIKETLVINLSGIFMIHSTRSLHSGREASIPKKFLILEEPHKTAIKRRRKRKAVKSSMLWPNAIIPFSIGSPEPDLELITNGIKHWEKNTCLKFNRVYNSSESHIRFEDLEGCRSSVGRKNESGQIVSLGDTCKKLGIVLHEIGHALGFHHEIRRPDRDDHVVINQDNVEDGELFNFHKLDWLKVDIAYDLSSIMHYRSLEWTKNGKTTVATRDPMLQGIIGVWKGKEGYNFGLSHRDKLLANNIYGCLDKWLSHCNETKNPCLGEGYLGPTCNCICPPGQKGAKCELKIGSYYDHLKSPCSREITQETSISSPHYPHHYERDTWCTFVINAGECRVPLLTILDFEMGPRDKGDQCFYDFLEIRYESSFHGVIKCASEVVRGESFKGTKSEMILFFKAEEGGYRGFDARITFEGKKGCCPTKTNGTKFHLMSPHFPNNFKEPFHCNIDLKPKSPAKLRIVNDDYIKSTVNMEVSMPLPCELVLCQVNGICKSYCDQPNKSNISELVLPNSGLIHSFLSVSSLLKKPMHIIFTMEPSPCHKTIRMTRKNSSGQLKVGPLKFGKALQCEWWIIAPDGYHVKLVVERLQLNSSHLLDAYFSVDEMGDSFYSPSTTRTFTSAEEVPSSFISMNTTLNIVFQGYAPTYAVFTYELYMCFDQHEDCHFWASIGECKNNSFWMLDFCRYSCLQCDYTVACSDKHEDCGFWYENDECTKNVDWMRMNCPESCGFCDSCTDENEACEYWKELGHCSSNAVYMKNICSKACNFCGDFENATLDIIPPKTLKSVSYASKNDTNASDTKTYLSEDIKNESESQIQTPKSKRYIKQKYSDKSSNRKTNLSETILIGRYINRSRYNFNPNRGNTTKRYSKLYKKRRVGTKYTFDTQCKELSKTGLIRGKAEIKKDRKGRRFKCNLPVQTSVLFDKEKPIEDKLKQMFDPQVSHLTNKTLKPNLGKRQISSERFLKILSIKPRNNHSHSTVSTIPVINNSVLSSPNKNERIYKLYKMKHGNRTYTKRVDLQNSSQSQNSHDSRPVFSYEVGAVPIGSKAKFNSKLKQRKIREFINS